MAFAVLSTGQIHGLGRIASVTRAVRRCPSLRGASQWRMRGRIARMTAQSSSAESSSASESSAKLLDLRRRMAAAHLDAVLVPSSDPHNSEYPPLAFARREYISGFTGSAGTALVTGTEALLWTDGRYFLQAEEQLSEEWTLMKSGVTGTPTITDWLKTNLSESAVVGMDYFVHTVSTVTSLQNDLGDVGITVSPMVPNLIDEVWGRARPALPSSAVRVHPIQYAGLSVAQKLNLIQELLKTKSADVLLVSMLDEVAWTLNIRGEDVPHCPVALAYLMVCGESARDARTTLFVEEGKLSPEVSTALFDASVDVTPYSEIRDALARASANGNAFLIDPTSTSQALRQAIVTAASEHNVVHAASAISNLKALKNDAELSGMRNAHLRDAAALAEFFVWLENELRQREVSEFEAGEVLELCRSRQTGFLDTSFDTIAGSGSNGAIIHYRAERNSCKQINTTEMFLLDSGGQYVDGTTDVTRTMHFGDPTRRQQECFTRVLQGHIALDQAVFPEGTTGYQLDPFARQSLWKAGLDYRHGTGHGVGACLNVHEGPKSISSRPNNRTPLRRGMIVSNEPGYYEDGEFGIRIENLLTVVEKDTPNRFGDLGYLGFERLTFVPIQRKLIALDLLSPAEIDWINKYHEEVCNKVSPLVAGTAKEWLRRHTEPLEADQSTSIGRRGFVGQVLGLVLATLSPRSVRSEEESFSTALNEPAFTQKCFMDISVDDSAPQRIVIGLYGEIVPKTSSNFVSLCTGEQGFGYRGTEVYRIVRGLTLQAGDTTGGDGSTGRAIYEGGAFESENFKVLHDSEGVVSMVKRRNGEVDSRFFVTTRADSGYLDNKYVAFGRVVRGMDVLRTLDAEPVRGPQNRPARRIVIVNCGIAS